jgi:hypothetical protein
MDSFHLLNLLNKVLFELNMITKVIIFAFEIILQISF